MSPRRALRKLLRRQDGSATVEFVIVFPAIISFLLIGVEMGWTMTQRVSLERALDIAVRDIRLGAVPDNMTHAQFIESVCAQTIGLTDCESNLMIEMRRIDATTWNFPTELSQCIDREEDIQPATSFSVGSGSTVMYLQACFLIDPIFPTTPLGLQLMLDDTGAYALRTASAFVNE